MHEQVRLVPSRSWAAEASRRRGFWEGDEGRAKGSGKDELAFPTILYVPLKATGYESVNKCKNIARQEIKFHREHGLDAGTQE